MKIAVISDIHEDLISLKKAFKQIEIEKCDQIICLGDILGYPFLRAKYENTRNASECIRLIKNNCSLVLLGNHEMFHLKKIPKYHSGFVFPNNWYDLTAEEKRHISKNKVWNYADDYLVTLNEYDIEYLSALSEFSFQTVGSIKILFSHFIYPNFSGYVSNYIGNRIKLKEHFNYIKSNQCLYSICGHMHVEGIGLSYDPANHFLSRLFTGFMYYNFGKIRLKNKHCSITLPALADNSQVNGFAILDTDNLTINAISLNLNRRFNL